MAPRYKYVHVDRLPAGRSPAPRYRLAGGLYPHDLVTSPMGADPEKLLQYAEAALKPTQRDIDHCTAEAIRFRIRLFNRAGYTQPQGQGTYSPEPLPAQRARIERLEQEALRLYDDRNKHAPEEALNHIARAYPNISARDMQLMAQRKDPAEIRRFLESRKAEMSRSGLRDHWDRLVEDIDRGLRSLPLLKKGGKPIAPPSPADHLRDLAMRAESRAKETGSASARSRARSAWMKVANALEAEGRSDTDLAVVVARNHARMFK